MGFEKKTEQPKLGNKSNQWPNTRESSATNTDNELPVYNEDKLSQTRNSPITLELYVVECWWIYCFILHTRFERRRMTQARNYIFKLIPLPGQPSVKYNYCYTFTSGSLNCSVPWVRWLEGRRIFYKVRLSLGLFNNFLSLVYMVGLYVLALMWLGGNVPPLLRNLIAGARPSDLFSLWQGIW